MAKVYVSLTISPEYDGVTGVCMNEYEKIIKPSLYSKRKNIRQALWDLVSKATVIENDNS